MKWILVFGITQGAMEAYQKGDSKQIVAPLVSNAANDAVLKMKL